MTDNRDQILTKYKDADFNQRLNIYLQFPLLRSDFILIDRNDLNTDLSAGLKLQRNSLAAQMGIALGAAVGIAKRLIATVSA